MSLKCRLFLCICLALITTTLSVGQESSSSPWEGFRDQYKLKVGMSFQLWGSYTLGQQYYDYNATRYRPVDDRADMQLRRTRLSVSGQPYPNLDFKLVASLDLVGRDVYSATQGGVNNGVPGQFGFWDLTFHYQPKLSSDLLHIHFGYMVPRFSRESLITIYDSSTFDKSWSQNYIRRALVGTGPGRAYGINVGGQHMWNDQFGFDYSVGAFLPSRFSSVANSRGISTSPLTTARISLIVGQPESTDYSTSYKVSYQCRRKGLTLAFNVANQGSTDLFTSTRLIGGDFLLNLGPLAIDGEYVIADRSRDDLSASISTGYVRLTYLWILPDKSWWLEPAMLWMRMQGGNDLASVSAADGLSFFTGRDDILDLNINLHLNPKLKFSLGYTINDGTVPSDVRGATSNNFFRNADGDAILRGDFIGVGMHIKLQ